MGVGYQMDNNMKWLENKLIKQLDSLKKWHEWILSK